jgi:hypothetical protein
MKNILLTGILIIGLTFLAYPGFAEENPWEQNFIQALQKGKAKVAGQGEGLGYTPSEDVVLETAIEKAMDLKAPACEVMKIAVDLKYSPYSTIKNIFAVGGEVGLDQLCMCATESGVLKEIIAKAASDATSSLGTPIFSRDEIIQSQCVGLGYRPIVRAPYFNSEKKKRPVSPFQTGTTEEKDVPTDDRNDPREG